MPPSLPPEPPEPDLPRDSLDLGELRPFSDELDDIEGQQLLARLDSKLFHRDEQSLRIGRWIILERLGAGAMGVVYAAYDPRLDRRVALKVLPTGRSGDQDARARMLREAQALAKISDPHVVQIYDVEERDENIFLVMELIQGTTLRRWQAEPRLRREVLDHYVQVAHGLARIHEAGLVHRDVKPDNVLVDGKRVVIADFGLVFAGEHQLHDSASVWRSSPTALELSLTADDAMVGTLGYMAPEQLAGMGATTQSDQFAFWVSLYEALTGTRPFSGKTPAAIVEAMVSGPPARAPQGPPLPRWLHRLLTRGLLVDAGQRFSSMSDVEHALVRGRDRGRRARNLLLVAGGLGLATLGYALLVEPTAAPCGDPLAELNSIWGRDRQAAIRSAIEADGGGVRATAWSALEASFEQATIRWSDAWVDECRERSRPNVAREERLLLAARKLCLDSVKSKLRAFSNGLAGNRNDPPNPGAIHQLANDLGELPDCNDQRALVHFRALVGDHLDAPAAAALRERLDSAHAEEALGDFAAAERSAAAVVGEAQAAGLVGVEGEGLYRRARNLDLMGRADEARALLELALDAAARRQDHDLGARSAVQLAKMLAGDPHGGTGGHGWLLVAGHELIAAGEDQVQARSWLYADYEDAQGLVAFADQRYQAAESCHRRALELRRQLAPSGLPTVDLIKSKNNLANVLSRLGPERKPEALVLYREALDDAALILGEDHPFNAEIWLNIGIQHRDAGQREEASRALRRAVDLDRSVRGEAGAPALRALYTLGVLAADEGDVAALGTVADQVEAIHERLLATEPDMMLRIERADELKLVAQARAADDDEPAAIAALERAAAILRPLDPVEHAWTLVDLAQISIAQDHVAVARARLEAALGVLRTRHDPVDAPNVADAEAMLAALH